ncbi:MAG: thermostable hemolysin [Zoogloeaceae bacterium]|jgi:hypothetical protein|nr:thermostable hemolysin [Zoogloeaceae bacterium]
MSGVVRDVLCRSEPVIHHTVVGSPWRGEAEDFVRQAFARRYGARISAFAPNLMALERDGGMVAVAGWRCAGDERLFLESYLDVPVNAAVAWLAGQPVRRSRIVEVGNLASTRAGGSVDVILALARHLDRLGYEWVVFTATEELIGIFRKLGLSLLALASADPARLPEPVDDWGSYYDNRPVVVAGRIRLALARGQRHGVAA